MKTRKQSLKEKPFLNKRLQILTIFLGVIIVLGFLLFQIFMQTPQVEFSYKAAIIDQIGEESPSIPESARKFNETVTSLLESVGFNVSYHKSESITVDFYKGLAKYDYGIIVLRAHAALREENDKTTVDFFTSQKFEKDKYVSEQNNGLLSKGNYSWEPDKFYFAITPKFIERLEGYFPKSLVIATGCWSLKSDSQEMATAFIKKGAKAYIGWTDLISLSYSDDTIIKFLQYFLVSNMTISEAINECNKFSDPEGYSGKLSYYPSEIGGYKLSKFTVGIVLNDFFTVAPAQRLSRGKNMRFSKITA